MTDEQSEAKIPAESPETPESIPQESAAAGRPNPFAGFPVRHPVSIALMSLLAVSLVLMVVSSLQWRAANQEDRARNEALAAARTLAINLNTFSYETMQRDFEETIKNSTGEFKKAFESLRMQNPIMQLINDVQGSQKAEIVDVAVKSVQDEEAKVLVFLNVTLTGKKLAQPIVDPSRILLTIVREGDRWLVSGMRVV